MSWGRKILPAKPARERWPAATRSGTLRVGQRPALVMAAALCFFLPLPAAALPEFLKRFAADPFSKPELRTRCATCHVSPTGGGPRNEFGQAFERERHQITAALRQKFPDRFNQTVTAAAPSAPFKATWSAANDQEVTIEIGGERYILNRAAANVRKEGEPAPEVPKVELVAEAAPREPAVDRVPTFNYYLVNLPTTRARAPRSLHLHFTHRFSAPLIEGTGKLGELFGLDSFSISSFGVEGGITKHIGFVTYRTPYARSFGGPTIEMGPVFNLLQQSEGKPVSMALRTTIEGEQNFTERFTLNFVPVASRAVGDVAEFFFAPSFHVNVPRRTLTSDFAFTPGERRDHLIALGMGASVRVRPRVALTAEWSPRVAGFRGLGSRNAYAFSIQRNTNRHVFALTFSNSQSSTSTRYLTDGQDDVRIGFNLYRRIW